MTFWFPSQKQAQRDPQAIDDWACQAQPPLHALPRSSQATVLELQASPDLLRPPWTQLDTSWGHLDTKRPDYQQVGVSRWASPAIIKLS